MQSGIRSIYKEDNPYLNILLGRDIYSPKDKWQRMHNDVPSRFHDFLSGLQGFGLLSVKNIKMIKRNGEATSAIFS